MTRIILASLALLVGLHGLAPKAEGYVRTLTSRGNPLRWQESCVFLVPPLWPPAGMTQDGMQAALEASAATWTAVAGSYLRFVMEPAASGKRAEYVPSGPNENVLVFVESGWPHSDRAAALTTLTYLASSNPDTDGRLVDTDVEINAEDFSFSTSGEAGKHDLENVMTHELGHAVGLDHTCDDGEVEPTPTDHLGNTIPPCMNQTQIDQLPDYVREATMFNYAAQEETDKRSLEPDDEAGIAAIYPLAEDPDRCEPPDIGGGETCACTGGGGPGRHSLPWLVVFGWLGLRRSRIRRS